MSIKPNVLTIAGSDSGAGAGIQADLKTIQALGGYGVCAITALTAQNGLRVAGIFPASPEFVTLQIQTIQEGFSLASAKTGMLFTDEIITAVACALKSKTFPLVVDPVAVSQSGYALLQDDAVAAIKKEILPLCDLLTPNIPEAELFAGLKITNTQDLLTAGQKLLDLVPGAVLIKGGHLKNTLTVTDYLFQKNAAPQEFSMPHIETNNNHGTGCTLSAALATCLAQKLPLESAVHKAQEFLNLALKTSQNPGLGAGPVNHSCLYEA